MYMAQIFFYPAKQGVLNKWFNRADTVKLNSKINQNKGKIKVTSNLNFSFILINLRIKFNSICSIKPY